MNHDTYDRRIQLGASRRRREDSEILHHAKRWSGSIYVGGYAIECALKALICHNARQNNLKDTRTYAKIQSRNGHSLMLLLEELPPVKRAITLDRTNTYKPAWNTITRLWQKDQLRYWDKLGNKDDSERFMDAVKQIHDFLLGQQGEAS